MTPVESVTNHERYFVTLAGVDICVDCSDVTGRSVPWVDAHGGLPREPTDETCSCGNRFDGDNFCMLSACQWEE